MSRRLPLALIGLAALTPGAAIATGPSQERRQSGIVTPAEEAVRPPLDILRTRISVQGNVATFRMRVSGRAGISRPTRTGRLAGSRVFSYVWPTTLAPGVVGFPADSGILAFAVTARPDFDDTPLFDENSDGRLSNDGNLWHSHWVVLGRDASCGPGALRVVDIPPRTRPRLPKTWPGLPLLIDSPGWSPVIRGHTVTVRVPFDDITPVKATRFDGVTAALRVNASLHTPLLCVANVFKTASGDLSLPGITD